MGNWEAKILTTKNTKKTTDKAKTWTDRTYL